MLKSTGWKNVSSWNRICEFSIEVEYFFDLSPKLDSFERTSPKEYTNERTNKSKRAKKGERAIAPRRSYIFVFFLFYLLFISHHFHNVLCAISIWHIGLCVIPLHILNILCVIGRDIGHTQMLYSYVDTMRERKEQWQRFKVNKIRQTLMCFLFYMFMSFFDFRLSIGLPQ